MLIYAAMHTISSIPFINKSVIVLIFVMSIPVVGIW